MKHFNGLFAALLLAAASRAALGDVIPYANIGTVAPQVSTYASGSGGINIYFFGSSAAFNDTIQVNDSNTGFNSGAILPNHSSTLGQELSIGTMPGQINAGDLLVFYINSPEGIFSSVASLSADGVNHGYITAFSGGTVNGTVIPAGLYVGLEDEAVPGSDLNYHDDTFVFTGVNAVPAVTPEPGTLALLGTGLIPLAGLIRRRLRSL